MFYDPLKYLLIFFIFIGSWAGFFFVLRLIVPSKKGFEKPPLNQTIRQRSYSPTFSISIILPLFALSVVFGIVFLMTWVIQIGVFNQKILIYLSAFILIGFVSYSYLARVIKGEIKE